MSTARKPGLVRRLSIGAALLGATAAPFALAMPAEATTTLQGCSVNPLAPVYAGRNAAFVKQIRHNFVIVCAPGRSLQVQQMMFEEDAPPDPDDFTGTVVNTYNSGAGGLVGTRGVTVSLLNTEAGPETVYQRVRFRVTPAATGVQGPWTAFETSGTLTIAN